MADQPLFTLDAEARWRLAYDPLQWVIQRRTQKPRTRRIEGHAIADSGWRGTDYVGLDKSVLPRCIQERGIVLTPEAQAHLGALPYRFDDFIAELADHVVSEAATGFEAAA